MTRPSPFESFDEEQLLRYVEDELDGETRRRLEAALAAHPEVLERLDGMRSDRLRLRELPEPIPPRDVLVELETVLARPMLVETRPGSYRRRYHRRQRRRRVLVAALAATLLLAGGAALTLVAAGWRPGASTGTDERLVMEQPPVGPSNVTARPAGSGDPAPASAEAPGAVVHHRRPLVVATSVDARDGRRGETAEASGEPPVVALPFALVVRCEAPDVAEQGLTTHVAAMGGPVTLVRNFSFDEARRIEAEVLATRRSSARRAPAVTAGVAGDRRTASRANDESDAELRRVIASLPNADAGGPTAPRSKRLMGPVRWAATPRTQLSYSGQGVSHCVTVPLSELADLLARLDRSELGETALCWLPRGVADPAELAWDGPPVLRADAGASLRDRARIRSHLEELAAATPDAMVVLPIAVRGE